MTYRCPCGFRADDLELLEDHLFTFPEDDHYELAPDMEIKLRDRQLAGVADIEYGAAEQ